MCVDAFRSESVRLTDFDFQASAFNHSAISPSRINNLRLCVNRNSADCDKSSNAPRSLTGFFSIDRSCRFRPLLSALDVQCLDERRESSWMLAAGRIVQEEPRKRPAPILGHADQCAVWRCGAACASDMKARPTPSSAARVRSPMSLITGPVS